MRRKSYSSNPAVGAKERHDGPVLLGMKCSYKFTTLFSAQETTAGRFPHQDRECKTIPTNKRDLYNIKKQSVTHKFRLLFSQKKI